VTKTTLNYIERRRDIFNKGKETHLKELADDGGQGDWTIVPWRGRITLFVDGDHLCLTPERRGIRPLVADTEKQREQWGQNRLDGEEHLRTQVVRTRSLTQRETSHQ
jgi:hypothetical protein